MDPNSNFQQVCKKGIFAHALGVFLRLENRTMAKFHTLNVKDIRKETDKCVSIAFDVPEELNEDFRFEHGQYITLKMDVNGEELRRSYSICSSPIEDELRVAVKKVENGRVSGKVVDQLQIGDALEVMTPMGNFTTQLNAENTKHFIAFAGGSGITPIISILKTALRIEPKSRFTLFYGNTDKENIIFNDQLEQLKEKYGERLNVQHILSKVELEDALFSGHIDAEKAIELLKKFVEDDQQYKEYFICGPEPMMLNVSDALEKLGVDKERIHIELFTSPVGKKDESVEKPPVNVSEGMSQVTVILDGEEQVIEMPMNGDAILDVALANGVDVPFACKGAVCCTCKAKVMEGKVRMELNYALSDQEVEEGFVLTCQSHPETPRVIVDYDEG